MAEQAGFKDFRTEIAPSEAPFTVPLRDRSAGGPGAPSDASDRSKAGNQRSYGFLVLAIFVAYMGLATALYYFRGVGFITPDRWAVLLFFGAILLGQGVAFVRDWVPFVLLVFGYEYMRGLAGDMIGANQTNINVRAQHMNVHVDSLINFDRALFGGVDPTLWLQQKLYTPGHVHWYDVIAALWYMLHFVLPCVFAFMLWVRYKDRFWQFTVAFLLMTYVAFGFFLFFPSAPPWLANNWGYLKGVQFPFNQTWSVLMPQHLNTFDAMTIWTKHSGNPVAAFPSLHAAFPWLVTLYAVKFYGKWGALFFVYNPFLWFSVVYSGNHWVVDILAGIAWATLWFAIVEWAWPRLVVGVRIPWPRPVLAAASGARTGWGYATWPYRRARSVIGTALSAPFRSSDHT
jgi:hypothetical protein